MSKINVSTITNRTGTSGPVLSGVTTATDGFHVTGGSVGVGTDVLAPSSRLTLFEESGNGQTLEIKAKNSGGAGSQPGIKFTANNGDNIGGVYGDVNSDSLKIQTGGTDRVVVSSAGTSEFTASSRVATFTGNGIEINNPLGSNVFIGTQSGTEGKIGTINNSNMALFANNNYSKRAELQTDGDFSILDGNLVVASGHGIDFSATGNGSGTMTSELLDDYEEGTFSPIIAGSTTTGTATYAYQLGDYVKIGRMVHVRIYVSWTVATGTGGLYIRGLPYTISSYPSYGGPAVNYWNQMNTGPCNGIGALWGVSSDFVYFYSNSVSGGNSTSIPVEAAGSIIVSGSYYI